MTVTGKYRFAVCVNNTEYPASLELHKIYRVLPDEEARWMAISELSMRVAKITCTQPTSSFSWSYHNPSSDPSYKKLEGTISTTKRGPRSR
jgi:hypothetical protein